MDTESFELKVLDVIEETGDARSISFDIPADAAEHFAYKPGQFLTVAVPSDQTGIAARCYSLCSSPVEDGPPTITVKRTVDGYASNWIVDRLAPGDSLRVLPPSGIFTPSDLDVDLLLFAGGSGHHADHVDHPHRPAAGQRADRALLRQSRRELGDLREQARRARRRAPGPAAGRALARVGAGAADPGPAQGVRDGVLDVRGVRVRAGAVHEGDGRRAEGAGVPAGAPAPGEVRLAGRQPVRRPGGGGVGAGGDHRRRHRRGRRRVRRRRGCRCRGR